MLSEVIKLSEQNWILNTRIQQKKDSDANWTTKNPILLLNELIIVELETGECRFKIGDGLNSYKDLPFLDQQLRNEVNLKVSKEDGKALSSNDFTDEQKTKLNGIDSGANAYTHPSTHPASMITGLPTSLPANGGNADTVDGMHASDFLKKSGGTITGDLTVSGVIHEERRSAQINLSSPVWVKICDFENNTRGKNYIISLSRTYNYANSEGYLIQVSLAYQTGRIILINKNVNDYGFTTVAIYRDETGNISLYAYYGLYVLNTCHVNVLVNDGAFTCGFTISDPTGTLLSMADLKSSSYSESVRGSYEGSYGGKQPPNYFGSNRVGFLTMNTEVNGSADFKDWMISDCYNGNDIGGVTAFGVNRQALGAYIMRSDANRNSWIQSAELIGTHNYKLYCTETYLWGGSNNLSSSLTLQGAFINKYSFYAFIVLIAGNSTELKHYCTIVVPKDYISTNAKKFGAANADRDGKTINVRYSGDSLVLTGGYTGLGGDLTAVYGIT